MAESDGLSRATAEEGGMKFWIRVDASAPDDPAIQELGDRLHIDPLQALGHCVALWGVIAEHKPKGDLGEITPTVLERWARWTRRKGAFNRAFRELFVDENGQLNGWKSRQGALLDRAERDRARWRKRGESTELTAEPRVDSAESNAESPRSQRGDSASTVRNGTVRNKNPRSKAFAADAAISDSGESVPAAPRSEPPPSGAPAVAVTNGRAPSWLDPIAAAYERDMGAGSFPWGKAGKALLPLSKHHPPAVIAAHLATYIGLLDDPKFLSFQKFAETFGEWAPRDSVDKFGTLTARGHRMLAAAERRA
jgi:hypothetical protein